MRMLFLSHDCICIWQACFFTPSAFFADYSSLQLPLTLMHWCQESCNLYVHNTQSDLKKFSEITCLFSVLRNLSSVNEKTRRSMRETIGIVESLVNYIKACLKTNRADEKVGE